MLPNLKRFKKVYIEISNICNLQCTFCPEVGRDKKQMDDEALLKTLEQVRQWTERVCFHVMGEPLQHPQFSEFVKMASQLGVSLEITTNGTLLSEATAQALLHPTVAQVNFSLQSFVDNFPKANPEVYLRNIFAFCHRARAERPDLYVNLRLWNLQQEGPSQELNENFFSRIEKEFGVKLNRNVDPAFNKSKNIIDKIYLHFDSRFEWPNINNPVRSKTGTCHGTRSHVAVHADGKVVPCCLDKEANIVLGDLSTSSFAEIIANAKTEAMRRGFESRQLVEDLCQRCTYIQRFD